MQLRPADPFPGYNPEDSTWEDLPDAPDQPTVDEMGLWDTEPHNWVDHNARRGASIIKAYAEGHDRTEPVSTAFSDLLADLRHAADAMGLDYYDIDSQAYRAYVGDRNP